MTKSLWAEELSSVLFAYQTTPERSMKKTHFSLAFGAEVIVRIETLNPSPRLQTYLKDQNQQWLLESLDLLKKHREEAALNAKAF